MMTGKLEEPVTIRSSYSPLDSQSELATSVPLWAQISFFTLGVGVLLPWNAILAALDYYIILFPDVPVGLLFSIAYMWPMYLTSIVALFLSADRHQANILLGIVTFAVTAIALPAIAPQAPSPGYRSFGLVGTLAIIAVVGKANALVQSSLFAMAAMFPGSTCTHALNAGGGFAGVLLSSLRILTLALLTPKMARLPEASPNKTLMALRPAVWLFFIICASLCLVCLVVFLFSARSSLWRVTTYSSMLAASAEPMPRNIIGQLHELRLTLRDIELPVFAVVLTFTITLGLFPAVFTTISMTGSGWFKTRTDFVVGQVLLFNVGDFVGKSMPELPVLESVRNLSIAAVLRIAFCPLVVTAARSWWMPGDMGVFALALLLGLTNGIVAASGLKAGPRAATSPRKELAGRVMFLALISGLALGAASGSILKIL
jgi:solute carrier family 29 (equilibrative nucleoside transporter), member 1/2/3